MTTEPQTPYLIDEPVIATCADKQIIITNPTAIQLLLTATGGDTKPSIESYIPLNLPEVSTVCVGSFMVYTETVKLTQLDLDAYHYTHSRIVALLHDKQKVLKELTKLFGELGYIDAPDAEVISVHKYYTDNVDMLWAQRQQSLSYSAADANTEDLPAINQAMIEAIAARYICAASIKFLADAQRFYELVLQTCTDTKQHFKCYRVYIADLDICAVYDSAGKFIDFCTPYDQDRQSLNANIFAGYRNPA